jgi:hypothetical protein
MVNKSKFGMTNGYLTKVNLEVKALIKISQPRPRSLIHTSMRQTKFLAPPFPKDYLMISRCGIGKETEITMSYRFLKDLEIGS